jgi:subtilase family serine protease
LLALSFPYVVEFRSAQVEQIDDALVVGNLPNNQSTPGGEAQLDVEYIMALAPNASLTFYSIANLLVCTRLYAM